MSSGAALPSITSSVITHSRISRWEGISYIRSSITSSRMERRPRAPVFCLNALLAIVAAASKAFKQKTGARGLRSILEEVMLDLMYEIPSQREIRECVITEDVIEGRAAPLLIKDHEKGVKSA